MATHTGSEGTVKVGANAIAEIRSYSLEETADTAEDTSMGDSYRTPRRITNDMSTLSLKAYREQVQSGKDLPKVYHVFSLIDKTPGVSLNYLRIVSQYPHQTLTSAISRLMDSGILA